MEKQLRPMIELKNINKSYVQGTNSYHVLHDINLTIAQGEFLAIMGQSGSGKSTLINIIGFLDDQFEGTYFYYEHPIHEYTRAQFSSLRNQNVGFVFQNFKLIQFRSQKMSGFLYCMLDKNEPISKSVSVRF